MKKNLAFIITLTALVGALSGCSGVGEMSNSVSENSGISNFTSDQGMISSDSDITDDQEITSAKCYKIDFQEVTEDQVAALFKAVPQKETNEFGRIAFNTQNESGFLSPSSGVGGSGTYYNVMYWTEQGDKYDSAAYMNYSEIAVNRDLSFLTAVEAENEIKRLLSGFMPTGVSVKAYAISEEYYSQYAREQPEKDKNEAKFWGQSYTEKDYGTAADYYYFTIEQTVDGIPIQAELIGNIDNGSQTWGSEASAVLSEEGLGYLRAFSPYKITGEIEVSEKFITFSEAEQMFKDKNDSFLTTEDITVNYSRLVYVVLRAEDNGLILAPAWEFKYNDKLFFRVNAYTGEEVVTV